ncbi:MAG: dihydroneopterin aldolase [Verrucomicrobiota bacterium]
MSAQPPAKSMVNSLDRESPDSITICDLEVAFCVGVTDRERANPQRLLLTVEMKHNVGPAAQADDLSQTIDYFAVCQRLRGFGTDRSWRLIETLAIEITTLLRTEFHVRQATVEVKKFVIREARYVSVRVTRPA